MDALLNMLEVCPVLMRHQITGIIADLCENRRIVPYVRAWRSDRTMVTAVELFCHHFEDEEVRLRIHHFTFHYTFHFAFHLNRALPCHSPNLQFQISKRFVLSDA